MKSWNGMVQMHPDAYELITMLLDTDNILQQNSENNTLKICMDTGSQFWVWYYQNLYMYTKYGPFRPRNRKIYNLNVETLTIFWVAAFLLIRSRRGNI